MKEFLIKIFYGFWRFTLFLKYRVGGAWSKLWFGIVKLILPSKLYMRYYNYIKRYERKSAYYDDWGMWLDYAREFFEVTCFSYLSFPAFLISYCLFIRHPFKGGILVLIGIFGLFYLPVYFGVLYDKKYVEYFEQYEMRDRRWKRKWMLISFLLGFGCIGMWILTALTLRTIGEAWYGSSH